MTLLVDPPIASSSTLYPRRPPELPAVRAAEDFYTRGPRPVPQVEIRVPGGSPRLRWLASYMEEQVNRLLQLDQGWDGRRAKPPTDTAVRAAMEMLFAVTTDLSLPPQVFPLPDGGLQLEWLARASVDIEVDSTGSGHVLTTDEAGCVVINGDLELGDDTAIAAVRSAIHELSVRLTSTR